MISYDDLYHGGELVVIAISAYKFLRQNAAQSTEQTLALKSVAEALKSHIVDDEKKFDKHEEKFEDYNNQITNIRVALARHKLSNGDTK